MLIDLAKIDFAPGQGGGGQGGQAGDGTWMNPYTVSEAISAGPSNDIYVKGEVVSVSQNYTSSYGLATYVIQDDFQQTMTVFRSYYFNNKKAFEFPSFCVRDLVPGDEVIVYGDTGWYGDVFEFTPQLTSCLFMLNGWRPDPDESEQLYITENRTVDVAYYGSVNVQVPQGVIPSGTITLSMNGTYDVTNYAQAQVNVSGAPTDYRYKNGTIPGLADLGWDADDIGYLEYNSPHYGWQDGDYTVSQDNKDLYGVVDETNYRSYTGDPDMVYLPKFSVTSDLFFYDFQYLKGLPLLDTSNMTSMTSMFQGCNSLITIPLLDTSSATSMNGMFQNCSNLETIPLLDTSNVTNMEYMFEGCNSLFTLPLLDTSNVTNMIAMFQVCSNLKTIPLLDTSNVTLMNNMFQNCEKLKTIPLLDTSNVTQMSNMFGYCSNLKTIPLLDTSNVTNMYAMFSGCNSLITIPALDTSNVTNMNSMFQYCSNLETIPALDTSNVTDMNGMFNQAGWYKQSFSINGIDFSSLTYAPSEMFSYGDNNRGITRLIVNGKIDFGWDTAAGFINCLPNLDYESVKSILQAMYRTTNNDPKTAKFVCSVVDRQGELAQLVTDCATKGWTVSGLNIYQTAFELNYTGTTMVIPNLDYQDPFGQGVDYITNDFSNGTGKIYLSSSPTRFGDQLFAGNNNLTGIDIPSTVTEFGTYVFNNVLNLTSVVLPANLQTLGDGCFYNSGLTSVTIPSNVQSIRAFAFWECYSLQTVTVEAMTPPQVEGSSIWTGSLQEIRVPQAALADYQNSDWNNYYGQYLVGY